MVPCFLCVPFSQLWLPPCLSQEIPFLLIGRPVFAVILLLLPKWGPSNKIRDDFPNAASWMASQPLVRRTISLFTCVDKANAVLFSIIWADLSHRFLPCTETYTEAYSQHKTTALILKGVRCSSFWSHFEQPWPGDTDLGYPIFCVPKWKQFQDIL